MGIRLPQLPSSQITPASRFHQRRRLLQWLSTGTAGLLLPSYLTATAACKDGDSDLISEISPQRITDKRAATGYNNYYEFSTDKKAVRILAQELTLNPWTIHIGGEVESPLQLDLDMIRKQCVVERIYRFRCIEGWSMVVPWRGVVLSRILQLAKPLSSARFVRFTAAYNPKEMVGQRRPVLDWPYQEGLRLDEALHPLTLLAEGMYGEDLPPQNGAPVRLVVPWKYGFKSIKAIQKIELLRQQPETTWQRAAAREYGFYANVNPDVPHPRWSQSREVPLGNVRKIPTLMFNGYAEQVAALYRGMDLSVNF